MDFELLLVVATLVSGLAAGWVRWRVRRSGTTEGWKEPGWLETTRGLFPVFLAVLLIRSFLFEPFRIPSGSMMPTLLIGDFIVVNKFAYGLRVPVLHTKFFGDGTPERGDVVVFRFPENPDLDYIKRVIGVPGDVIEYREHVLTVNGQVVPLDDLGIYEGRGQGRGMSGTRQLQEHLPGREHLVLHGEPFGRRYPCLDGPFVVPAGAYFVMGDNRDHSNDSRFWCTVPEANLVGRAVFIWMNWDWEHNGVGWDRIGTRIR